MKRYLIIILFLAVISSSCKSHGWLIEPRYTDAWEFSNGLAKVITDESHWAYIDFSGRIIIDSLSDRGQVFYNGYGTITHRWKPGASPLDGKYQYTTGRLSRSKYFIPTDEGDRERIVPLQQGDKWGYGYLTGDFILPAIYDEAYSFTSGRGLVRIGDKWTFVDRNGKYGMLYDDAWPYEYDRAIVRVGEHYGYIDLDGRYIIEPCYDSISAFSEGLAAFSRNGKYGYLNRAGGISIPNSFDFTGAFHGDFAPAALSGKYGLITSDGRWKIAPRYDTLYTLWSDQTFIIKEDGAYRLIDITGRELSEAYDSIESSSGYMILVSREGLKGAVTIYGDELIEPIYPELSDFEGDHAIFTGIDGKKGLIDWLGDTIILPLYDDLRMPDAGIIPLKSGGLWGYADLDGQWIIEPIFQDAWPPEKQIALVKSNGKYGYIRFNRASFFRNAAKGWKILIERIFT